jgi:hypothetical protein
MTFIIFYKYCITNIDLVGYVDIIGTLCTPSIIIVKNHSIGLIIPPWNVMPPCCDIMIRGSVCRNPSLGLATKARACKGVGRAGSLEVTSHAPGSAKECKGMSPHTPKWTPILGIWVSNGLPNLQRAITGVKTHWIEAFLISFESSWNLDV